MLAAGRAESWGWDLEFFAVENRRNLIEKRLVLWGDGEGGGAEAASFCCHLSFSHILLNKGIDDVDSTNARVGTSAFKNGYGRFEIKKNVKITMYVRIKMTMRRVQLVSQALSSSTRVLRALRVAISCSSCSMFGIVRVLRRSILS